MASQRIVIVGGCALAFGASFANTGLVLTAGTSVSHLTGDIAKLTINLATWSPASIPDVYRVFTAAACFFLGATIAGIMRRQQPESESPRPYGRSIVGIGVLFLLSASLVLRNPLLGIGLAAFGCGVQNALASHYRGLVLRTTHLTGMFTDFGFALGMRMRGHKVAGWKIVVPALLICSFFIGGIAAALVYKLGHDAIAIAGAAYCLSGACWSFFLAHR